MSDEALLVDEAVAGSVSAFEELVSLYEKRVYNYCYRMTNSKEDAEDIAQEVFIKIYRSLNSFKRNSRFSTWIYRIAYNVCIDNHRKKKINTVSLVRTDNDGQQEIRDIVSSEPSPEEQLLSKERECTVRRAIAELKPEYKTVIILRDIQSLSYDEIAEALDIPLGTVKSYLNRARTALRVALTDEIDKGGNRYEL